MLSIDSNEYFKNKALNYRRQFYGDKYIENISLTDGSWSTSTVIPFIDEDALESRKHKPENSLKGNYYDINWRLTRKLGEPLIANVVKPFVESRENINVATKTDRNVLKAKVLDGLLNYFNDIPKNRNSFYKRFIRNAIVDGTAFGRVGLSEQNNSYNIEVTKEVYEGLQAKYLDSTKITTAEIDGKFYLVDNTNSEKSLTRDIVDPIATHFDPLYSDMEDKRFFIVMENISLMDAIEKYAIDDKLAKKLEKIADDSWYSYTNITSEDMGRSKKMITLYEYWTKMDIGTIVDGKKVLRNRMSRILLATPIYQHNSFNCNPDASEIIDVRESPYPFNHVPFFRAFGFDGASDDWGDGIAELTSDLQSVQKTLINLILDNVANGNVNRWFTRKGFLDDMNKKALANNEPIIEVKRSAEGTIKDNLYQATFNSIPPSLFNLIEMFNTQSEEVTGVNKAMTNTLGSGLNASSSNFSAGLSLSQTRVAMIILNIKDAIIDNFSMWSDMGILAFTPDDIYRLCDVNLAAEIAKYATEKTNALLQGIEVSEEDTVAIMEQIKTEVISEYRDLSVKYDINIKVASEASKDISSQKILMLVQQVGSLQEALPPDVTKEFVAMLADNMDFGHIVNKLRNYQEAPNEVVQQLQELEIAEKAAGVEAIKANTTKDIALGKNADSRSKNLDSKTNEHQQVTPKNAMGKDLDNSSKMLEQEKLATETSMLGEQNLTEGVDDDLDVFA